MYSWTKRVKTRMQELDITQEFIANKMGITRGAITHYLAGRRVPPLRQFQKLAAILKVEPAWLQYGTSSSDTSKHAVNKISKENKLASTKKAIPLLTWQQAAEFVDGAKVAIDEISEFVPHYFSDQPQWYALRIKGDAMTSSSGHHKSFHEGEIILIDPNINAAHGQYVIALLPRAKEVTFKQYVVDGGLKYLKPLNPQYPLTQIDDSTHICGVVVGCLDFI